jgi:hypothetical protein
VRRVGGAVPATSRLCALLLVVCSYWMQLAAAQTSCSPGSGYSLITRTCQVCEPGRYSTGKRCMRCLPGHVAAQRGSRACTKCASNRMANADRTACVAAPTCRPGYGSGRTPVCTECLAGFYSAGGRNSICKFCPVGQVAARGSTTCNRCPAGQYANTRRSRCVASVGGGGGGGAGCEECRNLYSLCISGRGCTDLTTGMAACIRGAMRGCADKHPCINHCQ